MPDRRASGCERKTSMGSWKSKKSSRGWGYLAAASVDLSYIAHAVTIITLKHGVLYSGTE